MLELGIKAPDLNCRIRTEKCIFIDFRFYFKNTIKI